MVRVSKNFISTSIFQVLCYENWKSFPRNYNSAITELKYRTYETQGWCAIHWSSWVLQRIYVLWISSFLNDKTLNENHMENSWIIILCKRSTFCSRIELIQCQVKNWTAVIWGRMQRRRDRGDGGAGWRQRRWWQAADRVEKLRIKNVPRWVRLVSCTSVV